MAYLDHQEAYEDFKQAVLAGIRTQFPIVGSMQRVELEGLDVIDPEPGTSDDLRGQHDAKVNGLTWSSSVFANLVMKDKTGKVIQQKRMRIAEIPRVTSRYSYIVDGQEYQVDSQWQLKPGVYVRRMNDGQLESRFNTPTKKEFKILFEPATKQFVMNRGKSKKIPVYPLMKALGVDDDTLEQKWGKEVFAANKLARGSSNALEKFYKSDRKADPKDHDEAVKHFIDTMAGSELDPDVTKITLGKAFKSVDGDALMRATHKMIQVQSGAQEDDRDSLEFKNLRTTGDYAYDKMTDWRTARSIRYKMQRQVNRATDIRQVVKFGMLNDPIKKTFKTNTASRPASQINPLEMVASAQQTTIMGPGGIQNARVIDNTISLKLVNPSHLGFLDPVKTPESDRTGVILRLPTGVKKVDGEAKLPLYNLKTGKIDYLGPTQFYNASVVLPDQVTWDGGKPKPKSSDVTMSESGNKLTTGKFKDAQYVMRHPSQLFSLTTNLIPFLGSTSGNRATYAGFHLEQAISLKNREAPLVQVGTGVKDPAINSFEGILGRQAGHVTLKSGTVSEIKKDAIIIKTGDGKSHEVQLYNNFPLNDPKSVLHSTPIVKVGDKVQSGQSVADTNYTRGGQLALGTNLRVAYIPFKGYNFEDGVVISQSAANKMTSEHLYKESTKLADDVVRDVRRFRNQHQEAFNDAQYKKLGDDGVIKVGQKVAPGDPLVVAMTPFKIKDRMGISAVRRSLSGQHSDASVRWKSDYMGEVVAVHSKPDGTVSVHVRTEEPMQVGDKITGRYGNKGIVTQIIDDDKMPHTKDGKHIEVALNPSGVPGRMNLGQVLETAAAKIALKTGKPYIVNNFDGTNAVESVKAALKQHGINDQEELFDPETKQSLGKAMVGPQHMLKLVHQVDKKVSVRSGMPSVAGETPEKYDNNLIPSGSGKIGAQSIGHNGLYTMLAHGAKCFLGSTEITVRGSKKRNQISSIVRGRKPVEVLSFNYVSSNLEWKPVVAWQVRVAQPEELVAVTYSAITRAGHKKGYVTKCTGGHEFYTSTGKMQAADLKRGDSILIPGTQLAEEHRQLILGSTMGDACLSRATTLTSSFRVGHCTGQREYLEYKHKVLKPITRSGIQKVTKSRGSFSKGPQYRFWTLGHGELSDLRRQFYPEGKKIVPDVFLEEATEAALAFWLMDDADTSVNSGKYRQVRIHTCDFSESDVRKLCAWLILRWGVKANFFWKNGKKGKIYPCISVFNEAADRLLTLAAPYFVKCMEYKLQLGLGRIPKKIVGSKLKSLLGVKLKKGLEPTPVTSVKPYTPKYYEDYLVYNIEVDGNHNYFANGVLVGNSNIREMQTWKSEGEDKQTHEGKKWPSQHLQVWNAIQSGEPLPTPTPTFSFRKFTDMLKAAGVNIEKQGNQLKLLPFTDKQTLALSNGEFKNPSMLTHSKLDDKGELKPYTGGLFDPRITGGHGGRGWGHITLPEPVPNPVFENAIRKLTGLKESEYDALAMGSRALNKTGKIVDLDTPGSTTGGHAIKQLLDAINPDKELASSQKQLSGIKLTEGIAYGASTQKVDALVKKIKYLKTLQQAGMTPSEAYVIQHLPVIPPAMRPPSIMNGDVRWADLNGLYKTLGEVVLKLKDPVIAKNLTDEGKMALRRDIYDGVKAITGMDKLTEESQKKGIGILHQIGTPGVGSQPKYGYFQQTLLKRKQDLTMRSTIIPEPALGLDEIGLPKEKALILYKPFVVRKLVEIGAATGPLPAQKLIQSKDKSAYRALELVTQERPVLLKRDPALHKHSIQAFRPKLVHGNAIQIHPLTTGGFNADFDGDQIIGSVFLFISNSVMKHGIKALSDRVWPRKSWWAARRVGSDMAARFSTEIPFFHQGSLYLCDLGDVPHMEEKLTKDHIDYHPCPPGMEVLVYDESIRAVRTAPVSGWSFHRQREVEIVTLASGRQILTDDDERGVYGMDQNMKMCRRRPSEAIGMFVPVAHGIQYGNDTNQISLPKHRDERLREMLSLDVVSGHLFGLLAGDGWVSHSNGGLKGQVVLAAEQDSIRDAFIYDLQAFFESMPAVTPHERIGGDFGPNVVSRRYTVSSMGLSEVMDTWIGHTAEKKHLPPFFLTATQSFREGLLGGYMDSDGSISITNGKSRPQWLISGSTKSIRLANELRLLSISLGIRMSITPSLTPKGERCWALYFSSVDFHRLGRLPVSHAGKVGLFHEFFSSPPPIEENSHAKLDVIPVSSELALWFRNRFGTRSGQSTYVMLSNAIQRGYLTRVTALRLLDLDGELRSIPELSPWTQMVDNRSVRWDRVVSYERTGRFEDGYDLTVPGFETFMSVDGVILSNTMSAYVPISPEAVREAQGMFPSNNLYNEATGKVIYTPTLESALGLFKLSRVTGDANKSFSTAADALKAVKDGKLNVNHTVMVGGKKVTPGRLLIAAALPQSMQKDYLNADPQQLINKNGLNTLFERLAKDHKAEFGMAANRLKDLGNGASYGSIAIHNSSHQGPIAIAAAEGKGLKREYIPIPTHSLSLSDFSVDHQTRDKFVGVANKEVAAINKSQSSAPEKERRTIAVWEKTMTDMTKAHFDKVKDNPSNLALMVQADVKPSRTQYRQMVLSPGILEDATGHPIATPVTRSYSEGLDLAGYWTQSHGARGGTIKKVQEVRDPGYFSKQLMQAAMASAVVTAEDCGTQRGIPMNIGGRDIHDRVLASDFTAKGMTIHKGTVLGPDVVTKIRSLDKDANLLVRSTLKCEHEKGVCQKCAGISPNGGFYGIGQNLGVMSAQSLGERSVQLTLKAFHSGGVSSGGSGTVNSFERVQDLTLLPKKIANSATLAMKGGTIDKIEHDTTGVQVWVGGHAHHIGKDRGGELLSKQLSQVSPAGWAPPKVGMKVEAGQSLSDPARTFVNPHDLYKATGSMERVQNFLTDELHRIYAPEGVRRQHVETVVRSMGELTKVRDPGDAVDVMKGEYRNASHIRAINKDLARQGRHPVEHSPILKGIDVLPLVVQEDWMAKMMHQKLRNTVIEAAATGAVSDIHGVHPVPAMAYGAEVGLTDKDSLKPGLRHLKGVKNYNY